MSASKITVEAVKEALVDIVSDAGHVADPRAENEQPARYLSGGQPNCLVAHVLKRLGFSIGILRALDREHAVGNISHSGVQVAHSRHPALKKIDDKALALLQYVQNKQDAGMRWGRIVADAFTPGPWYSRFSKERCKPWLS